MTQLSIPWLGPTLAGGITVVLGLLLLLYRNQRRSERLSLRLRMVQPGAAAGERESEAGLAAPLRIVTAIGEAIASSGALSTRTLEELRQTLHVAGFRRRHGLGLFVGTKLLLVAGLPLATLALPWILHREIPYPAAMMSLAAGIGLLAPDKVVQGLRKRYLRALEAGIPDALDMMVICGQAGLGLEASIERVGVEIHYAHPAVAEELTRTAHEMQVNADTRTALLNLGRRTGLESVRRLAGVLIQSIQYGTPLTQALRSLSAEQRQEMLVTFEGRAARLPVLLTIPMIVFILPCVFLVVAGPAMVDVYRTMMK
ncbi:MAG: type II secretion system F family protein [Acetobacteraceae bacterium]